MDCWKIFQFLESLLIGLVKYEILLFYSLSSCFYLWNIVSKVLLADVHSFLLLWKDNHHYFGNTQIVWTRSSVRWFNIKILEIQIVYIFLCVWLKEGLFVDEAESKRLETLIKQFHVLLTKLRVILWGLLIFVPVEHIPRIVYLVIKHLLSVCPNSSLYESYLCLLMQFMLNLKPNIALVIDLVHIFDQRSFFQELVAHLIFDMRDEMKEIIGIYLWITENVPEEIGERCFNFY